MTKNEAIKLIQEIEEDGRNITSGHIEALDLAIKALEERPQGEWLTKNLEKPYGKCNQCGEICEVDNYCGNCGAKMLKGGAE